MAKFLQKEKLSFDKKLEILEGIASGIYHLHANNIIHRDLKAENILLDAGFEPKISVITFFGKLLMVQ